MMRPSPDTRDTKRTRDGYNSRATGCPQRTTSNLAAKRLIESCGEVSTDGCAVTVFCTASLSVEWSPVCRPFVKEAAVTRYSNRGGGGPKSVNVVPLSQTLARAFMRKQLVGNDWKMASMPILSKFLTISERLASKRPLRIRRFNQTHLLIALILKHVHARSNVNW